MSLTKKSKGKIAWIIIACVIVCSFLTLAATRSCALVSYIWSDEFAFYEGNTVEAFNQSYSATDVKKLRVDYPAGKLIIQRSDESSDTIQVVEDIAGLGSKTHLNCSLTGATLDIGSDNSPSSWFPWNWLFGEKRRLVITIPSTMDYVLDSLDVHLASGFATITDIAAKDVTTEVGSGTTTFNNLSALRANLRLSSGMLNVFESDLGTATIKVSSGTATIDAAARNVNAELSSGKLDLSCLNTNIEAIKASVTSGTVTIAVPRDLGFDAAATKTSGSFNCEFDCAVRGDVHTHGDARVPIDISITSGMATLKPLI